MSCKKWESDIALFAGGDLPAGRVAHIEAHLAQCADCRSFFDDLRASHALLAELRDEPLEDAMVARVRQRVLAGIGAPRPARLYWKLALAATLILAVFLAWPRHHGGAARAVAAAPTQVAWQPAPTQPPAPRARRRRRHAPAAQPGKAGAPPLLVQFVTDDPNIVIYWLVDQKPQGD